MTIFWINLAIVFIFSAMARYVAKPVSIGPVYSKPNKLFVFLALLSLILVSGLRSNIGDTFFYMYSYTIGDFSWSGINFKGEFGFYIYQLLLKNLSSDPQILIFVTALITNVLIVIALYKYANLFEIAMFLYITSGVYLVTMNGIRQMLAASIVLIATKYILNGNWKKYILIVLIASTIHTSALFLLPVYFIVRRKPWSWSTSSILIISVLVTIVFSKFPGIVFLFVENTTYGHYQNFNEGGANILRAAVCAIPLIIAYLGRKKLKELWPKSDIIVNLSLLNFVVMVLATQNWIFARIALYFSLYNVLLITWIIPVFKKNDQKLVYYGVIFLYLIYYFYEMVISLGVQYKSNYF